MAKGEKIYCPNCREQAIQEGNKVTCESCDVVFTIEKRGEPKVKQLGRIEQIEKDVAELKRAQNQDQPPEPDDDQLPEPDDDQLPEPDDDQPPESDDEQW